MATDCAILRLAADKLNHLKTSKQTRQSEADHPYWHQYIDTPVEHAYVPTPPGASQRLLINEVRGGRFDSRRERAWCVGSNRLAPAREPADASRPTPRQRAAGCERRGPSLGVSTRHITKNAALASCQHPQVCAGCAARDPRAACGLLAMRDSPGLGPAIEALGPDPQAWQRSTIEKGRARPRRRQGNSHDDTSRNALRAAPSDVHESRLLRRARSGRQCREERDAGRYRRAPGLQRPALLGTAALRHPRNSRQSDGLHERVVACGAE